MINRVHLAQPAWHLTVPHRVAPLPDEWLPGVLLRCDEANHWGSATTFSQILHPHHELSHQKGLPDMSHLVVPSTLRLDYLAELLAVSLPAIVATTYQPELVRIFGSSPSPSQHLGLSHSFRLCPACIAQRRMLWRTLVLLNITCCLEHQVMLQERCTGFHATSCPCASRRRISAPCTRNRSRRPSGKRGCSWATFAHTISKSRLRVRSLNRLSSTST